MRAIGTQRIVLAHLLCHRRDAVSVSPGALLANHADFVSPAMMLIGRAQAISSSWWCSVAWDQPSGPLFGAVALLVLECSRASPNSWQIILGPLLLLVVLYSREVVSTACSAKVRHG